MVVEAHLTRSRYARLLLDLQDLDMDITTGRTLQVDLVALLGTEERCTNGRLVGDLASSRIALCRTDDGEDTLVAAHVDRDLAADVNLEDLVGASTTVASPRGG